MYIGKLIRCLNDGRIWPSAKAAAAFYGCNQSGICAVCKGSRIHIKGFMFEYAPVTLENLQKVEIPE